MLELGLVAKTQRERIEIPELGRRERNKRDKHNRIVTAARRLFVESGYDDTTVRMIASEADIGLGTLFTYAVDKRDLLFLLINEDLGTAWEEAEAEARLQATLPTQLKALFARLYRFFGSQPTLARYVLRELQFYGATEQAAKFEAIRERTLELVAHLIEAAIATGEVRPEIDVKLAARLTFSIYQAEIRRWIATDELDLDDGIRTLSSLFEMLFDGLQPNVAPPSVADQR